MGEFISKIGDKSPELLSLLLLVYMFLKAMKEREQAAKERDTLFIAAIRQVSEQHLQAREESKKVIAENTQHTERATVALATMTEVMRQCGIHLSGSDKQKG